MNNKNKQRPFDAYKKYRELNLDRFLTKEDIANRKRKRAISFSIIALIFFINSIFNIVYYKGTLLSFYMVIVSCFLVSIYYLQYTKDFIITDIVASATLVISFCLFAMNGELIKFNILWIFAIPILWYFVVNYNLALITNIVFSAFFFIVFYTPIRNNYTNVYSDSFLNIFPFAFLIVSFLSAYIILRNDLSETGLKVMTYYDTLTGLSNRAYYKHVVNTIRKQGLTSMDTIVVSFDVNSLKKVNDTYGHDKGDILIKAAADAIKKAFKDAELVSRIGGDEFVAITYEDYDSFKKSLENLDNYAKEFYDEKIGYLTISKGYARAKEHPYINPEKLYIIADKQMYINKTEYYKTNNIDRRRV